MKRAGQLVGIIAAAWFVLYGFAMTVNPPRGEAVITADQQAALAADTQHAEIAVFDFHVSQVNAAQHCEQVQLWKLHHPGQYPARMVQHLEGSGRITVVKWDYPAAPGELVLSLCGPR